jgi:hypothetical protein
LTKDLIIVRAGTRSLHTAWLDPGKARNWDLFICPYEALPPPPAGVAGLLVTQAVPGTKWEGLKLLLHKWQGWREYRYVMLADEDLYAPQDTWSRFFERCAAGAAKLAQPAFAEDAPYRHWVTVRNSEFKARRVSCVDAAMPCFRADALAALPPGARQELQLGRRYPRRFMGLRPQRVRHLTARGRTDGSAATHPAPTDVGST